MHPDETLPRAADPAQSLTRPRHPQGQPAAQMPAPKSTSKQQQQQQPSDSSSHHHTQAVPTTTQHKQASPPQPNHQQLQQQQGHSQAQPLSVQLQQLEQAQKQTDFPQHLQQPQQQPQPRRRQETEQERDARSASTSTGQSATRHPSQSSQYSSTGSGFDIAAPMGLHHHLLNAAHYGQELQQRNAALEVENRRLAEMARQQRMSALEWCQMAKTYQQHRDLMTLRLEELEMELVRMAHKEADKAEARTEKSSTAVVASSLTSHQLTSKPAKAPAKTAKDDEDYDLEGHRQFLSQSITQILDEMTPKEKEPILPIHSKTGHGGQGQEGAAPSDRASKLPSALKHPSKSSKCKCGCQEEIRAWKTRCKYVEGQAMAQELKCEQLTLNFDGQKKEWAQWKTHLIQQQYQRRMRAAMPFNTNQFMSPFESGSPQQQYPPQQARVPTSSYDGSIKRARFESEVSETSLQRQDRTERNTRFNQITTSFVPGGQVVPGGHADRQKSSSSIKRATGKGSAEEPHILIDRDEGSSSDGFVGPSTSPKRPRKETTAQESSDGSEKPSEYESLPLSPTFPSDMTLRLRQYHLHMDDSVDDSDGYTSPTNRPNMYGQPGFANESACPHMSRSRNPATPTRAQQSRVTVAPDSIPSDPHAPALSYDYASDRSSPPMFDTADFIPQKASSRQVRRQTAAEGSSISRAGATAAPGPVSKTTAAEKHHQSKSSKPAVNHGVRRNSGSTEPFTVYEDPPAPVSVVLETPLELQGVRGDKPGTTLRAVPEVIEIAEDDHVVTKTTDNGGHEGGGTDVDASIDVEGDGGGSDKENSPPEHPIVTERRVSDGMIDFERATSAAPGRRDISPSKANIPEWERIYNFTERRKSKRKLMHGHNCECCRRFYELTGPLPLPDGYSHFFQPIPRPGEKEVWEKTDDERLQDRIQEVSRHRVQHMPPLTPPGFWDTDFPSTPERKKWDEIDRERRERKREQERHQAEQLQRRQQRRNGGGSSSNGVGSSSRAGPSGASNF
ncbi:hypothetical protein BGW39_009527 [Mortierella sp. 14UC]|nr:hypothetical protein BGW39_009527 [Mortierella sp. 14UC]